MRKLLTIILLTFCVNSFAQQPTWANMYGAYNFKGKGIRVDSLLMIPSFADTATANTKFLSSVTGALIRVNDKVYVRYNSRWYTGGVTASPDLVNGTATDDVVMNMNDSNFTLRNVTNVYIGDSANVANFGTSASNVNVAYGASTASFASGSTNVNFGYQATDANFGQDATSAELGTNADAVSVADGGGDLTISPNKVILGTAISGTVTLGFGTFLETNAFVSSGSRILLTYQNCVNCGILSVGTITENNSFVINSSSGTDGSAVAYFIFN